MSKYSVIIPVYNRPDEMKELLQSLVEQDLKNFELIVVEDGSSESSETIVKSFENELDIKYFFKQNTGPGDSRNFGMSKSNGEYLLFFDSDCVLPYDYFTNLDRELSIHHYDAFGGPDSAHDSFTSTQKAINYAMTSFLTTGGIRGKKNSVSKFQPRSFNMGIRKKIYDSIGGFSDIHPGEDPDLSIRIRNQGYKTGLIPEAYVYHKRRIDFKKFVNQVYKFGLVRVILNKWYPEHSSPVFYLPTLFSLGSICLLMLSLFYGYLALIPLIVYTILLFFDALLKSGSLDIASKGVVASYFQLFGYGYGFLNSLLQIKILNRDERSAFPQVFFSKK